MVADTSLFAFAARRYARMAGPMQSVLEDGPWFRALDRLREDAARAGDKLVSFATYDYLGLADHPAIRAAAHEALDEIGVGALGSRLVGGERRIHGDFERRMAAFVGTDSCLTLVSGYLTNLSTISSLMGRLDLIVYDELSHNSIVAGALAGGATHKKFRHNDLDHLRSVLRAERGKHPHCLIVSESLFSMDGDIVDLPGLLQLKDKFGCWLLLDEAHSIGVLGKTGRGICEHFGEDPRRIDVIVGTLSKTFAACGGFVCVGEPVLKMLRYSLPGFVYSVGLPPVIAASAKTALDILIAEPQRVDRLRENSRHFLEAAATAGLSTGITSGNAIIPVHFAETRHTLEASAYLLERGIYAPPIVNIGVPQNQPRIRFFVSAAHTPGEIDRTIAALADYVATHPDARVDSPASLADQPSVFS